MKTNLVELINKVQKKHGDGAFEISNYPIAEWTKHIEKKVLYDEGDLTKNYVKFSTDLLSGQYGEEFLEEVIVSYGETLKTNIEHFSESYQKKSSSIKEIQPNVFIHTSMSSLLMESILVNIVRSARLAIKFLENKKDTVKLTDKMVLSEALKHKTISDLEKNNPDVYRSVVRFGLKNKVAEHMKKNKKVSQLIKK
jgi:hypothetical protein